MREYIKAFEIAKSQLEKEIDDRLNYDFESGSLFRYHTTIANLKHLLPEVIENQNLEIFFQKLLHHQCLASLDQCFPEKILEIKYSGAFLEELTFDSNPKIYCTYHLGSYRAIIGHLVRFGKNFTLAVDENVYKEQKNEIIQVVTKIKNYYNSTTQFEILNVERFDAAIQLHLQLKKRQSLVVFADGNTGSGGIFRQDNKMQLVDFLGKKIFARKGIAKISCASKIPIVPVNSYRESETDVVLHFHQPIIPPKEGTSTESFITNTTQKLFNILESILILYPLQWEGWFYLHKYLDSSQLKNAENKKNQWLYFQKNLQFNKKQYGIFKIGKEHFLFNYSNYQAKLLNTETYNYLKDLSTATIRNRSIYFPNSIQKGLLKNNVLI